MTLHLNKFESPSPKDACFVPNLVEIDPVVREKKISKFRQCIFAISNYLRLEKCVALYLKKNRISFTQGYFVLSLVEIGSVVLEKKVKM